MLEYYFANNGITPVNIVVIIFGNIMNKKSLYKKLDNIKSTLNDDVFQKVKEICTEISFVATMDNKPDFNIFTETSESPRIRNSYVQDIHGRINKEKQNINFKKLIVYFYQAENNLQSFISTVSSHPVIDENIESLSNSLDRFTNEYNEYRLNSNPSRFYELSFYALEIINTIKSIEYAIDCLLWVPENINTNEDNAKLELYLSNVTSLTSFGKKLEAIDAIYIEITNLIDISIIDHPIFIQHIENGSLWLKIAGNPITVAVLTSILNYASTYYIDNFTAKGQIEELSGTIGAITEVIKLSDELQKHGIDTTDLNDHINKASKKIANKLDILLMDQPNIEVNDKNHNLGDAYKDKLLEQSKTKLITFEELKI